MCLTTSQFFGHLSILTLKASILKIDAFKVKIDTIRIKIEKCPENDKNAKINGLITKSSHTRPARKKRKLEKHVCNTRIGRTQIVHFKMIPSGEVFEGRIPFVMGHLVQFGFFKLMSQILMLVE